MNVTAHFTEDEVTARGGVAGADREHLTDRIRRDLYRVCSCAEVLRARVGQPIRVTSGFRHGDPLQHGDGQALDIQIDGMSPLAVVQLLWELRDQMPHPLRQVIAETNAGSFGDLAQPMAKGSGRWVHMAVRGEPGSEWAATSRSPWLRARRVNGRTTYDAWRPA